MVVVVNNISMNNQIRNHNLEMGYSNSLHLVSICTTIPNHHKHKNYMYQISPYMHTLLQFLYIAEEVETDLVVVEMVVVVVKVAVVVPM